MNLRRRNSNRAQEELPDPYMAESQQLAAALEALGKPEIVNRQKLTNELWTRIIRVGDEYLNEIRLHPILTDMNSYRESPPDTVNAGKKPWALLFDPDDCDLKHEDKTEAQMMLKKAKLEQHALKITELREHLRGMAQAAASKPD